RLTPAPDRAMLRAAPRATAAGTLARPAARAGAHLGGSFPSAQGGPMRHGTRLPRRFALLGGLGLLALTLPLPGGARAQQAPQPSQAGSELRQIADDVYMFRDGVYQTMFIVTDDGVIAADPIGLRNPAVPQLYREAIASVTDQPVRYVVYGHDHND